VGRLAKRSADWFPHDGHASDRSRTLTILENRFGAEGYMAWFKLLERLSTAQGHAISCRNPEETEFLAAKLRLTPDRFEQIISKMAALEGIDCDLWESDRVIWCQNLVDNLKPSYDKRRQELPPRPSPQAGARAQRFPRGAGISVPEMGVSVPEMGVSVPESAPPQDSCSSLSITPPKRDLVEVVEVVEVVQEETRKGVSPAFLQSLGSRFPGIDIATEWEDCQRYWIEHKRKMKAPQSALLNWLKRINKGGNGDKTRADGRYPAGIPGNRPAGAFDGLEE
jgi:hypothetical protein